MVREANRQKRVDYAQQHIDNREKFPKHAFSDELSIHMGYGGDIAFRKVSWE